MFFPIYIDGIGKHLKCVKRNTDRQHRGSKGMRNTGKTGNGIQ